METEKTNNITKRNILGSIIIVISMMIIGISLSYAYYINSIEDVNAENQGVSVTSGALTMNFATTNTLSATSVGLVKDSEVTSSDLYTAFSITLPSDSKVDNASYNIILTDIAMTSNFKSADLKWALYNSTSTTAIATGDFSGVTLNTTANSNGTYNASDISVLSNVAISKGTTTSYKLYIWLSYDDVNNQNDLLNGNISVKVGFNAVSKSA